MKWAKTVTHTRRYYPKNGLARNFCRNPTPATADTIWCFVEKGNPSHMWEYCKPLPERSGRNHGRGPAKPSAGKDNGEIVCENLGRTLSFNGAKKYADSKSARIVNSEELIAKMGGKAE
jgi:hypothetical protein